jgi:hypothetical protein
MILTAEQHKQLALACLKDAAAPQLTLEEKRELQGWASRFWALLSDLLACRTSCFNHVEAKVLGELMRIGFAFALALD